MYTQQRTHRPTNIYVNILPCRGEYVRLIVCLFVSVCLVGCLVGWLVGCLVVWLVG